MTISYIRASNRVDGLKPHIMTLEVVRKGRPPLHPELGRPIRRVIILYAPEDTALREISDVLGVSVSALIRSAVKAMLTPRQEASNG
jgi:hypothetical protein